MTHPTAAAYAADAHVADGPTDALCPQCGYDLRGNTSGRCSECGLTIDPAAARASGFAWAGRRQLGRPRAFVRTAWQAFRDPRRLRHELARPQDARDAAAFRRWNAAAIAAAFAAVVGLALALGREGLASVLALRPPTQFGGGGGPSPTGALQDLAIPWAAGAALWPVLPTCGLLLAYYLAGASRDVFHLGRYPAEHRARARAVGAYAAGPLWLLLPAAAVGWLVFAVGRAVDEAGDRVAQWAVGVPLALTAFAGCLLAGAGALSALVRAGQWSARAVHGGAGRALAGSAELLGRWVVGTVAILGVVPWCVGLVWVLIDACL
jgi:hypothetical protein